MQLDELQQRLQSQAKTICNLEKELKETQAKLDRLIESGKNLIFVFKALEMASEKPEDER